MKPTRNLFSPTAIRNRLFRMVTEAEKLNDEDDPLVAGEQLASILQDAAEQLTRGGFARLYVDSRKLLKDVKSNDGVEYLPIADAEKTKQFLARCIRAVNRSLGYDVGRAASAPVAGGGEIKNGESKNGILRNHIPGYVPPSHRLAYKQYQEVAAAKGGDVKDRAAYVWLSRKYRDLPAFETWTRYVRGGRRANNDKKNFPRHGRPLGRSIVRQSQI